MSETLQHTPLEVTHVELGAKMVPFAGWFMPVQYTSIIDEHTAVRKELGVFDISHMGQFLVSGPGTSAWLNRMFTNNVDKLAIGQGQYSLMLNERGGVIDDLILYRTGDEAFFIVVNASMIDVDFAWLAKHQPEAVELRNESNLWAGLAIQGPNAAAVYQAIFPNEILPVRNGIHTTADGCVICRTGYTGEDGFEFFCPAEVGNPWLKKWVAAGAKPCGLGARDSLRLEMCYPLNGSDLSPERTPLEAGLGFFVDLNKADFIGRDVLVEQKAGGLKERLVALRYTAGGAPPRSHYGVFTAEGEQVGELSSGVFSPSLSTGIGMAYVPAAYAALGTELFIDVRGRRSPVVVVKKPFYQVSKA